MKNPNGYGSVVKLSGNRRKPFVVRKTLGYDERAYPIYAIIGYFEKRADAMQALAEYNANPYDIDLSRKTFAEIFELWKEDEYPKMQNGLKTAHNAAFKHCAALHSIPYKRIRKYQMQKCIDDCEKGYATKTNIRNLLTHMDAWAYDHDVIVKQYSKNLQLGEKAEPRKGVLWTSEEIEKLWSMKGDRFVDETLFLLYTGMRVSEMLQLRPEHIHDGIIQFGLKTNAGRDRIIPIHPAIQPIIDARMDGEYVFPHKRSATAKDPEKVLTANYVTAWKDAMDGFGFHHHTHDCRKMFRSTLDKTDANKASIDLLMGHRSQDVGVRVYTIKTIDDLKETISKLSYTSSDVPG